MKKYRYIRAWCRLLGSSSAFTKNEVARARADKAPETALYQRHDGTWATFEGIQREDTKREIQAIIDEMERAERRKSHG